MAGFLDNLKPPQIMPLPFTGGVVMPPPFTTPPPPPRVGSPPMPKTEIPVSDFVTPMPEQVTGQGFTDPSSGPPADARITLTPEATKQKLVEAGFDADQAEAFTNFGRELAFSDEMIAKLLRVKMGNYQETTDEDYARAEVARELLKEAMADDRLADAYARGLEKVTGNIQKRSDYERAAGDFSPATNEINLYDVGNKAADVQRFPNLRAEHVESLRSTLAHELGHHVAQRALGSTYMPGGWGAAIQMDTMRGQQPESSETRPFVTGYAKSGQSRGAALSEDFADSMKYFLDPNPGTRAWFQHMFPVRTAVLSAITAAMLDPETRATQLNLEPGNEPGTLREPGSPYESPGDLKIGQEVVGRRLMDQALITVEGDKFLEQDRNKPRLHPGMFDRLIDNPDILEAVKTARQGYRYADAPKESRFEDQPTGGGGQGGGPGDFLGALKQGVQGAFDNSIRLPFTGGVVAPPPFVTPPDGPRPDAFITPPTPPISGPFTTPPRDIPVSDFVTPMPPDRKRDHITLTPDAMKAQLESAGFSGEDAAIILGQASVHKLSPERIAELLNVAAPPGYTKGRAGKAEVERVRSRMEGILADPRLKDEYVRGLDAITAYIHPDSYKPNVLGEYMPTDKEVSVFDTSRRLMDPDDYDVHGTVAHEIGHHIAEWALGDTVSPEGWAMAMQLDMDRNGEVPFVTEYPGRKEVREGGNGISEDFAESSRLYFSLEPQDREEFRRRFPARAAVIGAVTFALVNPDKERARLGVPAATGTEDDPDFPAELFDDMNVGRAATAKKLLEQEIAVRKQGSGTSPGVALEKLGNATSIDDLKDMRRSGDWDEVLKGFAERVTNPAILEALCAADMRSSQWSRSETPSDVRAKEPAPRELLELESKALDAGLERARTGFQAPTSPEHQAANAQSEAAYQDLTGYWNAQRQPDPRFQDQPSAGGGAVDQYLPLIKEAARRHKIDWTMLAGLVDYESGGKADAYRTDTGATGLGQVLANTHMPGRPSKEKLMDPAFNLDYAASMIEAGIAQYGSEEKSLAAYLGAIDRKGNITGAKDANGTGANKYIAEIRRRQGGYKSLQSGDTAGSTSRRWPLEGYDPSTTRITTKYGGAQTITAGMDPRTFDSKPKGADGKPINTGVDLAVKEGTSVLNPDDGRVVDVRTVGGNHGGYGNTIKIQYGDGTFVRYSHLQEAPNFKVGQTVKAGARLGGVGSTGNATGPHLDMEAQDAQGNYFDALQWIGGKGTPMVGAENGYYKPREPFKPPFSYNPAAQEQVDLGWSAEELLAGLDEDPEFAPVPAPRTLNSRSNKMASPTTQMPNIPITGPDSATLQALFTMMYTISQQAYNNLNQAGKAPSMVWDPAAFDDGQGNPVGGFVPSGGTTDTLAAINQAVTNNRSQITTLAAIAGQTGRVPVVEMGEDGYIYQLFGEDGKPVYQESQDSRNARLQAGQSVGYVSKDLLSPQAAPQGTMRRIGGGPTQQQPAQGQPAQQQQTQEQATDRFMPGAGEPQVNSQGGSLTNPATGGTPYQGQPIYSSNETGMQYPSGQGQGSAYSLNPAPMSAVRTASDGQTFGSQPREVQQQFVAVHGAQAAEDKWLEEHNQAVGGGGGGSLDQQISQGAVQSENSGDTLQERVRRRIETGVVPTDMLTVAGSGQEESIVNAPVSTIGDLAARNSSDPAVRAALQNQQPGRAGPVASPANVRAQTQSANRQAPGESSPRARGAAVNEAGTTGVPFGQGLIQHPGVPGRTIQIRPEYMQHLQNPNVAPGYIEGSGTYNQYPLDQPGLFGAVPNSGSNNVVNLRYGLGGTGDPTTGLETQTPDEWVQGAPLFDWQHPGERPGNYGYDHLVTLFMRSDTPSGMGTPTWSAPEEYWQSMYNAIRQGHVKPTQRGWAMLAQRGVTPQSLGMR